MKKVTRWEEVIDNIHQFNHIVNNKNSVAYKRFSQFFHWYYLPQEDLFAPSKFIGYKNTTVQNYQGEGSGSKTQIALEKFFKKAQKKSKEYSELKEQLESFAQSLDKKINRKTFQGTGGIYLPKQDYVDKKSLVLQTLYNIVSDDLSSMSEENKVEELEGAKLMRLVNVYERKPSLRAKAIAIHGFSCQVCGFNFEEMYGPHGKSFIEVHHLKPLSELKKESLINPNTDMAVVCANCHRMIHRKQDNPLTIEDLQKMLIDTNKSANSWAKAKYMRKLKLQVQ